MPSVVKDFPKVSVIIAMRNEEGEIERLISSLMLQSYPASCIEFIFVNDHSDDLTLSLLKNIELDNLVIINMPEGEFGKKKSIYKAVNLANSEIILVSDADCSFPSDWIRTMVSYFNNEKVMLVSGPVSFYKKQGLFESFQALEFISLIASGAGAIGLGNAIFCNGANMAYRKDIFLEVNNFINDKAVSGDDVFLLHSIKEKYPNQIYFAKDKSAIVTTESAINIKDFLNQRKRWTSKSAGYKDFKSIYTSFLVLLMNLIGVLVIALVLTDNYYLNYFFAYFAVKFFVDCYLLLPVLSFLNRKDLIKWIFPFEFLYAFYIVFIVILSFTNSFEWKGRIHEK